MERTSQTSIIKSCIDSYLDKGLTDKIIILNEIVDELGVPRPTIRRIMKDLRIEHIKKAGILSGGF